MSQAANQDEADLLARAQAGDQGAFGALCSRYEARLRRRVERRLSSGVRRRVAASDIIQEANMVAFDQIAGFEDRGEGSFGRWLGRIVDLKAQQLVRHHAGTAKRAVSAEVTRAQRGTMGALRGRSASPSQVAMGAELREAAKRAVARLPQNYRQVIELIQGEGLTTAEAAERLGRTTDSIKGLYSRALARLARELNLHKGTP
jgi:RNA polymerase sigma-70 factor (ECF subfamily)